MTATFNNLMITNIQEVSFIGGTYKELVFDVYDAYNTPIDISTFSCNWVLSPYGQPDYVALSKTGVIDTTCTDKNRFIVYLYSNDTIGLSGKYVQQPVITANPGYEFRLGQGYVYISPSNSQISVTDTNTLAEQVTELLALVSGSVSKIGGTCGLAIPASGSILVSHGDFTGFNSSRVVYDDGGYFTGSTGSNLIIPETGIYVIEVKAEWKAAVETDGVRGVMTYVNGVSNESNYVKPIGDVFFGCSNYMTLVTRREKGETMEFAFYQNSGSNTGASGKIGIALIKEI